MVLCRHSATLRASEHTRAFPCFHGLPCRFCDDDLVRIDTDSIRARRLATLVCWCVTVGPHPFSPEVTLGEGLLQGAGAGAMLTLIRAATIDRDGFLLTYYLLNYGLPMGLVASRVNRARLDTGREADFFRFGNRSP